MKKHFYLISCLALMVSATTTLQGCDTSSEQNCCLGLVVQEENDYYLVRIVESPEDLSAIRPPSLVLTPVNNLNNSFTKGDEVSFIVNEYSKVSSVGPSTGYPALYLCSVKPCKCLSS